MLTDVTGPIALALTAAFAATTVDVQSPAPAGRAEAFAAAARRGDAAAVTKLLDEGVDVNTKYRYGATALSYAADHGRLEVVRILIGRGADVNVKDSFYGATPLTWAASPAQTRKPEHAEIVRLLLKAGATGINGALISAASEPDVPMLKGILDHGGLSAAALSDALEAATREKSAEAVKLLEAAGAKPHPELTLDAAQLARYVGTYRSTADMELVITATEGRLLVNLSRMGGPAEPAKLAARSETLFVAPDLPGFRLTFRLDDGKVPSLTLGATTYVRTGGQ